MAEEYDLIRVKKILKNILLEHKKQTGVPMSTYIEQCVTEAALSGKKEHWTPKVNIEIGIHQPTIYMITNKNTGLSYIGKTLNPFTNRWHNHFFCNPLSETKLYKAICASKITDWVFQVIEIVDVPTEITDKRQIDLFVKNRESYWIKHHDTFVSGYNGVK
jgi:hypothetical protein